MNYICLDILSAISASAISKSWNVKMYTTYQRSYSSLNVGFASTKQLPKTLSFQHFLRTDRGGRDQNLGIFAGFVLYNSTTGQIFSKYFDFPFHSLQRLIIIIFITFFFLHGWYNMKNNVVMFYVGSASPRPNKLTKQT
jgi:hypothetical protein